VKTELDLQGGTNYTTSGTTQLLSVPYSLYASDLPVSKSGDTVMIGKSKLIIPGSQLLPGAVPMSLSDGLVAYYPFNGNANDESGNGNHGTVNGARLTADRFGNTNKAYNFNGISDHIIANTNNFPAGNSKRSVSAWFKVGKYPSPELTYVLFNYGSAGSERSCGLAIDSIAALGSNIKFFNWNNGDVSNPNKFELNVWHNLIGIYDGTEGRLYFNGILVSSKASSWNTVISSFMIGKNNQTNGSPPYYLNGELDEVRIYNRVLTQSEISYIANN
jgi:hypothetical protein